MLLELGALASDELLASASEELLSTASDELLSTPGFPQPSGAQGTPYKGCVEFSLVQLAQKKAVVVRISFFQCLRMFIIVAKR